MAHSAAVSEVLPCRSAAAAPISPFLSWVGGKHHLVKRFLPFLPADLNERVYREPFLGAGSLFFAVRPSRAFLSDANSHLINCFEFVRDYPDLVADNLGRHSLRSLRDYYYRVRETYNRMSPSPAQAARFIYLNKTCFNGVFRVNQKGQFNVPYGNKARLVLPSRTQLRQTSHALSRAVLEVASFEKALGTAARGDFIYLDPPYPPLNCTSYFRHYTTNRFQKSDHERLAETIRHLDARGCMILLSNADTPEIRRLYRGFNIVSLSVVRYVTCKAKKYRVQELLISNYGGSAWRSDFHSYGLSHK